MGVKLMDALRTFKVEGELVGRTTGPVVTQFEVEPAPGVKVRQFANLSNDLALAMRARVDPHRRADSGARRGRRRSAESRRRRSSAFRELIETRDFQSARAALPIALGKDLEGKPVIADLAKMPHLLIAGATGSGKSVCVNTIITSLVYRHTPRTLRFLMVDPKMVELSVYNTLPHLRHKVITDNRDAAAVLKWAVMEMQERYELLAANGCRNIQDFNKRVQEGAPLKLPKRDGRRVRGSSTYKGGILPYIVVVIDEMADLMMTVQGEVETPIAMLAQKARAIGIHLILATQRPSVNVITGLIKANFPSRIAFRVASQIDSRTIIDGAGAEMLLGNGDMLFIPPGKSRAVASAGRVSLERGHREADGLVRGAARARSAPRSRRRAWCVEETPTTSRTSSRRFAREGSARRGRRRRRRGATTRRSRQAVPRGGRGGHPAPAGVDVAAAAATQGRLRPRGAHHRPAAFRRGARPAGRLEAARRARRARGTRPHMWSARAAPGCKWQRRAQRAASHGACRATRSPSWFGAFMLASTARGTGATGVAPRRGTPCRFTS